MVKPYSLFIIFLVICYPLVGCAPTEWEAPIEKSAEIVWPPPPNPIKVRYLGEIKKIKQTGSSLTSILIGNNEEKGSIQKPVDIAVGKDGRMAIADLKRNGVHFFIPQQKRYRLIYKAGDLQIQSPVGVVFDNDLNLYVADSILNAILVYDIDGTFTRQINSTKDGPFGRPTGLAFGKQTNSLYVTDTTTHKIHVYDQKDGYQYSIGARGKNRGEFNFPTHLACDINRRLYVTDTMNFRVQIYDETKGFVAKFGNHGNGSGDFAMPKGVGVDRWGVIYVVDNLFETVQLFDERGNYLLNIGARGIGPGEFWLPTGLFIDHQDRLYICDTYNERIQVFQLYDFILSRSEK